MKKVLFLTRNQHLMDDFSNRLRDDDIATSVTCWENLDLLIDGDNTSIRIRETNEDLSTFNAIICICNRHCNSLF